MLFKDPDRRDVTVLFRDALPFGREVQVPTSASFRIGSVPFQIVPMSPDGALSRDATDRIQRECAGERDREGGVRRRDAPERG